MDRGYEAYDRIAAQVGTPFFVVDLERFRANLAEFGAAFRQFYPETSVAYSYKTNYIPLLCRAADEMGALAEVVSEMELDLAIRYGVDPGRIVYNGPSKTPAQIAKALSAGSMVNLDSFAELDGFTNVCTADPDRQFTVGLRANFAHAEEAGFSRFGFSVERGDFARAAAAVAQLPNARVVGIHCHLRVPGRRPEGYAHVAREMIALAARHFDEGQLECINLGGGYFSRMSQELARQFEGPVPSYSDYGAAIGAEFRAAFDGMPHRPRLILEPGTAIAADAMRFVTRVTDIRRFPDRSIALTDGSVYNVKPTLHRMNLPLRVVAAPSPRHEPPFDVAGYTCKEDDVMYRGLELPVGQGDFLVFDNVGAYTVVLQPSFIRLTPPIIREREGELEIVRRAQSVDDLLASFVVESNDRS